MKKKFQLVPGGILKRRHERYDEIISLLDSCRMIPCIPGRGTDIREGTTGGFR